jgi:hypothetical protein
VKSIAISRYSSAMRYVTGSLFCLALLRALMLAAWQAPASTSVLINVTEPTGMGVADAHIRVVPAPDHTPAKMDTDSKGRLLLDLKPGGYALFVSCPGFASVATHIEIHGSGVTQISPVALQIAPSSPPVKVLPPSEENSLLISAYPYHEDFLVKPGDFKSLPHTTLTIHNGHSNRDESYSGVLLVQLLAKAGAPLGKELRGIALSSYLVATGSDGYQVVLSLAEVDPAFHPGTVLVADSLNGQPLDAKSGPYKLVVSEDKRPARCVRNLTTLEIKSAH